MTNLVADIFLRVTQGGGQLGYDFQFKFRFVIENQSLHSKKITSAQAVKPELRLVLLVTAFSCNLYCFHIAGCRDGRNSPISHDELEKLKLSFVCC